MVTTLLPMYDLYDSCISLTGVDMSSDELLVAKNRLPKIKLYHE